MWLTGPRSDSIKKRRTLLIFVWSWVLIWPLLVVWIGEYLMSFRFATPAFDEPGVLIADTVIAGLPFLILAIVAHVRTRHAERYSFRATMVATAILMAAAALLWGSLYYSSLTYNGGGANIGLGLLLVGSPLYLPLLIPLGLWIGRQPQPQRR